MNTLLQIVILLGLLYLLLAHMVRRRERLITELKEQIRLADDYYVRPTLKTGETTTGFTLIHARTRSDEQR